MLPEAGARQASLDQCQGDAMTSPASGNVLPIRPNVLDPRILLDMIDLGQLWQGRGCGLARKGPGLGTLQDPRRSSITYLMHGWRRSPQFVEVA